MTTKQKERIRTINLFLSFATEDFRYSQRIRNLITLRSNLKIFTTYMLGAGEDWDSRLIKEIKQCDIFILLISLNAPKSTYVLMEAGAALGLRKPIIAIDTHPGLIDKLPMVLPNHESARFDIESLDNPDIARKFFDTIEAFANNKKVKKVS
jgi:hypothetical protein